MQIENMHRKTDTNTENLFARPQCQSLMHDQHEELADNVMTCHSKAGFIFVKTSPFHSKTLQGLLVAIFNEFSRKA